MEYQLEKGEDGLCRLHGTLSEAEVLTAWKKAAAPFSASFRMAGFRPGKAPLEVLEKRFGPQITEEATTELVERVVNAALAREGVTPVSGFSYGGQGAARGRAFTFSLEFCVLDDMALPALEELSVKEKAAVADPVQEELFLRDMLARIGKRVTVTEGSPQDFDFVDAEVTGRIDGRILPGMKTGSCRMRLVPNRPGEKAPDLDPVVRRLAVGETGTGTTVCPDNYPDPSLRGRDIELTVKLCGMEREELPPLTDETAQKLGFRNVEALKAAAREQALALGARHARSEERSALVSELENLQDFEAPAALTEKCRREAMRLSRQYLSPQYASSESLKESRARMREEAEDKARRKARVRALLLGWARKEGIDVSEEELGRVLAGRAARQNMDVISYRRSLALGGEVFELRAAMLEERALDALLKKVVSA